MADLSKLTQHTKVTFPQGKIAGVSTVLYSKEYNQGKALLIVTETPFHPLSCSWPDQQAGTGSVTVAGKNYIVVDALTAAINLEDENGIQLYIDAEIPSRHNAPSWRFFVAHIIDDSEDNKNDALVGKEIELQVDAERRKLLSAAHTSTHLAALALNKATKDLWKKDVERDGLDNPDLDRLAMEKSVIEPGKAIDKYRFGKSLRKKTGFEASVFFERLGQISDTVNRQLVEWIGTGVEVVIETSGSDLESRRNWTCCLDGTLVKFPCGGTHLTSLNKLASINVSFDPSVDLQEMIMHTQPTLKA